MLFDFFMLWLLETLIVKQELFFYQVCSLGFLSKMITNVSFLVFRIQAANRKQLLCTAFTQNQKESYTKQMQFIFQLATCLTESHIRIVVKCTKLIITVSLTLHCLLFAEFTVEASFSPSCQTKCRSGSVRILNLQPAVHYIRKG